MVWSWVDRMCISEVFRHGMVMWGRCASVLQGENRTQGPRGLRAIIIGVFGVCGAGCRCAWIVCHGYGSIECASLRCAGM